MNESWGPHDIGGQMAGPIDLGEHDIAHWEWQIDAMVRLALKKGLISDFLEGDAIAAEYGIRFIPGLMVVDRNGTVSYRRSSTELPPGKTVAELWSEQVRAALDQAL